MVKFGIRKPNLKSRVKARTTGRAKRAVKRNVNPLYGKKGMGWVKNPKRAAYNKVYNKTTVGIGTGNTGKKSSRKKIKKGGYVMNKKSAGASIAVVATIISLLNPLFLLMAVIGFFFWIKGNTDEKPKSTENKKSNTLTEEELDELSIIETNIDSILSKLERAKTIPTFFKSYDEYVSILRTNEKLLNKAKENDEAKLLTHKIENQSQEYLMDFIIQYNEKSKKEALKLKTESGQQNNYERSKKDLLKHKRHLEDFEDYINDLWDRL